MSEKRIDESTNHARSLRDLENASLKGLLRRAGPVPKRPLADVLIGAFALRFQGILTRNDADFRQLFPTLNLLTP